MGFLTRDYTGITMRIMRDVTAVVENQMYKMKGNGNYTIYK